ncbi:hypothetical protein JCM19314_672 [Nonlabens ulvanivorans]|uniref:Uncharacterized protein n=1 Tax=Nonlabens ulvanivorans TaxID=906888 RepID=A0A090QG46_NONUL|nr:hypothetical protein JCM19314_672 [Nonlabens ulvanivorans]
MVSFAFAKASITFIIDHKYLNYRYENILMTIETSFIF